MSDYSKNSVHPFPWRWEGRRVVDAFGREVGLGVLSDGQARTVIAAIDEKMARRNQELHPQRQVAHA